MEAVHSTYGDLPPGKRLRHRVAFWWSRLFRRDYALPATLFGQPLTVVVSTSREFSRTAEISYEGEFIGRLLAHLRPGDVFFDVGANIGLVGLIVARRDAPRVAAVHAFEPEPRNLAHLRRNIAANHLDDRIQAHGIALSHREGRAALHVRGQAGDGRHSLVAAGGATGAIEVEVTTMSAFCAQAAVSPDVIKIDVEGAEGEVLAGMDGLLARTRPRELLMEIHDKGGEDRMPDGEAIDAWLAARGYTRVWERRRGRGRHRHYRDAAVVTPGETATAGR